MSENYKEPNKTAEAETVDSDNRTSKQPEIAQIAPIVWPKAARVWVEAITVIIVTAALAIIIAAMDFGLRIGIETLTQF